MNDSTNKRKIIAPHARIGWDIAHGHPNPLLGEALSLGGRVVEARKRKRQKPQPQPQPPAPPAPPAPPVSRADTAELAELAAFGDMIAFRKRAEALAVEVALKVIRADGCQPVGALAADIAYLLDISTETAKRYIRKHSSRYGRLRLDGDRVCERSNNDGMG